MADWNPSTVVRRLVGQPGNSEAQPKPNEVVTAPEFNVTQYAKKLAVVVGIVIPAAIAAAKALGVSVDDAIVVASFGVTAAALLSVSAVMATDIAARAYADRSVRFYPSPAAATETGTHTRQGTVGSRGSALSTGASVTPISLLLWVDGETEVGVAVAVKDVGGQLAYLVLYGSQSLKDVGSNRVAVFDNSPRWVEAERIVAAHVP